MRRFPVVGFLLAVLCLALSVGTAFSQPVSTAVVNGQTFNKWEPTPIGDTRFLANPEKFPDADAIRSMAEALHPRTLGDVFPGKVIYAKGVSDDNSRKSPWTCAIKITAPKDADVNFDASAGLVVGPNVGHLVVPKGGARVIYSDELRGYMRGNAPEIGVMDSAAAISVSSFLWYDDGKTRTAFSSYALLQRLSSNADRFRVGTAVNTAKTPQGEIGTFVTLFNTGDEWTPVMVAAFDKTGQSIGGETLIVAPFAIVQQKVSQSFDAGTLELYFGCNFGPCPTGRSPTYFLVTSGPSSGATVDSLKAQNIGAE